MGKEHKEGISQRDKKLWLLFVVLVLMTIVVMFICFSGSSTESKCVRMCKDCHKEVVITTANINDARCPYCGGRLGNAYKCRDCDFEFAVIPKKYEGLDKKELRKQRIKDYRCPNCFSENTSPVVPQKYIDEWRKKKEEAEKEKN